jgi:acetyl-CoA synthetase
MTPTEQFRRARDLLFACAGDQDRAHAEFRWPAFDAFNWARDWFDVVATNNTRPAVTIVRDGGAPVESTTFVELATRSRRVATYLHARGVARGDRVLVMLNNVTPLWETMLAAMRLGAVVIPATTQLTSADIVDRMTRGDVRHVVADAASAAKLSAPDVADACIRLRVKLMVGGRSADALPAGFAAFDDARSADDHAPIVATHAADPLLLYFTSGTTAKPKLVMHSHTSYPVGHLSTMFWIGLRDGDVHQNISSPGWAKHAWSSLYAPFNAGASVLVHDYARFDARRSLAVLHDHAVDTLCSPPTVWRMLILEALGTKPAKLREVVSAGEPLNPEVIDAVQTAWGLTIRDGYGQTETTAQIGNAPGLPVRPGSMGKPLPGYEIALLDAAGRESDDGEIALRLDPRPTPLMAGYLDDPDRTDAAMAGGFYRTGDEARRDADGYIHFVGRDDDVFKASDYRISPFELESVLIEHDAVAEAAIIPSPDPLRHTVPKAFVTLVPGATADAATARAIFAFCSAKLAPYKRIRRLEFAALPKTISGKIRRVELRAIENARRANDERGAAEFWLDDFRED